MLSCAMSAGCGYPSSSTVSAVVADSTAPSSTAVATGAWRDNSVPIQPNAPSLIALQATTSSAALGTPDHLSTVLLHIQSLLVVLQCNGDGIMVSQNLPFTAHSVAFLAVTACQLLLATLIWRAAWLPHGAFDGLANVLALLLHFYKHWSQHRTYSDTTRLSLLLIRNLHTNWYQSDVT